MTTYNGWTNYETWAVKLWLDNDEGSYLYWGEQTQEAWDAAEADNVFTRAERARLDLADVLKEWHDEQRPLPPDSASVFTDLLGAALSEVDWHEIAKALLDDHEVERQDEEVDA